MVRIHRHERTARLQHRQNGNDRLGRARQRHRHPLPGRQAKGEQPMRQAVRSALELAMGPAQLRMDDRGRIGPAPRLRRDQAMHRPVVERRGTVIGPRQPVELSGIDQGNVPQGDGRLGDRRVEDAQQMPCAALDRAGVEALGRVADRQVEIDYSLSYQHDDVGVGARRRVGHRLDLDPGAKHRPGRQRRAPFEQHRHQIARLLLRQQLERHAMTGGRRNPGDDLTRCVRKARGAGDPELGRHDVL